MVRVYLILTLWFIFSTKGIIAQEQERVIDNPEVQSLLALSKSIQSGEIGLLVNKYRKGKSAIETKKYKVIFSKTKNNNKYPFNYNILRIKDSIQYIYNGQTWYVIDHKKKICKIDTTERKIDTVKYSRDYALPYTFYGLFFNTMFRFYTKELAGVGFYNAVAITDLQKTENTRFLKVEINRGSNRTDKKVLWIHEFEWDINNSTLFRYSKTLKKDAKFSKKTAIKEETFLTEVSLNDEKYADAELYNGLNFAKSYKVIYGRLDMISLAEYIVR